MNEHRHREMERHCDVAVVGGSAAGLAAALQLGRQGRTVIVVDAGEPRNAPAGHVHGYLGHEGLPPGELAAIAREEVRRYGAEVLAGLALTVDRGDDGWFRVELTGGTTILARRVLAATGLTDELPAIEGLARHWGGGVVHCPFCHGYEVRDRRVVQIVTGPMGLHPTPLFRQLTDRLTVVVHDGAGVDDTDLDRLRAGGVAVVEGPVRRILTGPDGHLAGVELAGGARLEADAVAVGPRFRANAGPFAALGLHPAPHPSGLGDVLEVGPTGETAVAGVYAAGNVRDPSQQVLHAAADGSRTGAMIAFSLAEEDLADGRRPSANQTDWDHRYDGDRMWSGNPNGTLVREARAMVPGRALDVGAGEGGDALWLAERGWRVTASDVSTRALDHLAAEAGRRGLTVDALAVDANAPDAFGAGRFDLVCASYASIPRTADDRAAANLLAAVAPGGTLLVVGHDLAPMRAPIDPRVASRAFDADAFVRVDDVAAALLAAPGWEIEVHETRPRPHGAASSHHVDDVVLRARRLP